MSVGNSIDPIAGVGPARVFHPSTAQGFDPRQVALFTRAMGSAHNDIPMRQRYAFEDTSAQSNKTVVNDAGKAAQSIFNRAGTAVEKSAAGNAAKAGIGTAIGDIAAVLLQPLPPTSAT